MKMRTTVLIGASVFAQYELPEKTANKLRDSWLFLKVFGYFIFEFLVFKVHITPNSFI